MAVVNDPGGCSGLAHMLQLLVVIHPACAWVRVAVLRWVTSERERCSAAGSGEFNRNNPLTEDLVSRTFTKGCQRVRDVTRCQRKVT
jgi:hypothetical protein